jgi:hypothetical protein
MKTKKTDMPLLKDWEIQYQKDIACAERKEKANEKHLNTKIPLTLESFMYVFDDVPNNVRLEIIKSLIWTSNNMEEMWQMVCDKIANEKFERTLD